MSFEKFALVGVPKKENAFLDEFRKIPERRVVDVTVFSGKTFSTKDFEINFVGKAGKLFNYPSFISTSKLESVAEGFVDKTIKWAENGEKVAVIQRIVSKDGVYIDDLSDWGYNLGKVRHSNESALIQIQREVILNPSDLIQVGEPIAIMENGSQKLLYGLKTYYVDFIQVVK